MPYFWRNSARFETKHVEIRNVRGSRLLARFAGATFVWILLVSLSNDCNDRALCLSAVCAASVPLRLTAGPQAILRRADATERASAAAEPHERMRRARLTDRL